MLGTTPTGGAAHSAAAVQDQSIPIGHTAFSWLGPVLDA